MLLMAVYKVEVIIPTQVHADNESEAIELAKSKVMFERKDLRKSQLVIGEVKQTSMF